MNRIGDRMVEPAGEARVVAQADVVVVGGGPAGMSAALAAARNGAKVALLERYNHLGGLASGGMVLVLDDMWDSHHEEISVRGTCMTMIERLAKLKLATFPRQHEWGELPESYRRWARWGTFDFHSHKTPYPICFAASFDPDGWKRVSLEWVEELGIQLRLHSWFSRALVEDGRIKGVICETKAGREAILGDIVIDATGDLDVAASAGAPYVKGSYIMTTVFRLGGVDTDAAERFEYGEPAAFAVLDKQAKKMIGNSWAHWWLKTPLPGVVWCNCPHMPGLDGLKVEDLTHAEIQGRKHIANLLDYIRGHMPGFERSYVVDVAPGSRLHRAISHDAAEACREPAGRRAPLLGHAVRAKDLARDSPLHGDGRGRGRRGGDGARQRRQRPRRRCEAAATKTARAGRRPGRPIGSESGPAVHRAPGP